MFSDCSLWLCWSDHLPFDFQAVGICNARPTPQRSEKQQAADDQLLSSTNVCDLTIAKNALKSGADVNAAEYGGKTTLISAAKGGCYKLIDLLLDAGANPIAQDDNGVSAVDILLPFSEEANGTRFRLLNGGSKPEGLARGLIEAVIAKDLERATDLIKQGAYVDYKDKRRDEQPTPLLIAGGQGNLEMVKLLVGSGARVNRTDKSGRTPLITVSASGNTSAAELLISSGASMESSDAKGATPLIVAASYGHVELTKMLLNNKAPIDQSNYLTGARALEYAISNKHPDLVPILLKAKPDLNLQDNNGMTPLMFAAGVGDLESAKLLLQAGANPNLKSKDGSTALVYARQFSPQIVTLLEPVTGK